MTRNHYALLATLAPFCAIAQPLLQHPGAPTSTVQTNALLAADPGAFAFTTGTAQTWNALSVTLTLSGTATFGPAGGPEAAGYPEADRMLKLTSPLLPTPEHTFLHTSSTALSTVATNVPASPRVYTDTKDVLRFPMEFQDQFTDTYEVNTPEEVTWTYSGYGTLITSAGIYSDLALVTSDDDQFIVWHTDPLYPLVMSQGDGFVLFDLTDVVSVTEVENKLGHQPFSHDRAGDILHIDAKNTTGQWQVTDPSGRIVANGQVTPSSNLGIPLGHLSAGLYVATFNSTSGTASMKFVMD